MTNMYLHLLKGKEMKNFNEGFYTKEQIERVKWVFLYKMTDDTNIIEVWERANQVLLYEPTNGIIIGVYRKIS